MISNPQKQVKQEYLSAHLLPDAAILDLRMTMTLPPKVTASTGIDALCHAIESFTCLQKNPMSDAYAAGAIPLIMRYLPIAAAHPGNKEARMAMANASLWPVHPLGIPWWDWYTPLVMLWAAFVMWPTGMR